MQLFKIILVVTLFFTINSCVVSKKQEKPMLLFLLIGQSNMAGRGKVEIQDQVAHNQIFMLDKNDEWLLAKEPLHFDKPEMVGVGLGFSFAKTLIEKYPKNRIGLIPCAIGGSPIAVWQKNAYHEQTKTYPYDEAIRRTKIAMQKGKLCGILWHQGESDSKAGLANNYQENLIKLISDLRKELGENDLPFVAGTLGDFLTRCNEFAKIINQIITKLPDNEKNTFYVLSKNLKDKGDSLHFDSPAYRELGRRYAEVFIQKKLIK